MVCRSESLLQKVPERIAKKPKKNRKEQRSYDKYLYKLRHLVEKCFPALKRWKGIAIRYAKTSDAFIAAVHVRCIAIWAAIRA